MSTIPSLTALTPIGTEEAYVTDGSTNKRVTLNAIAALSTVVPNATHTGDVTGSGALTIASNVVTLAKMATMATASLLGRNTAGTGNAEVLSATTARTLLNVEDGADVTDATNVAAAGALLTSGGTMAGTLSLADNIVSRPVLEDYAIQGSAIGNVGATRTFDCVVANYFTATLDQACTFTFSNPPATGDAGGFRLVLTNGGAFAITFPAAVDWDGGTAPTLTAAGVDIIDFTTSDAGTIWYGTVVGSDMK